MPRRGCPSSPAPASLPDNDDILSEVLLCLAPAPSSLPRDSLVCKHWRRLVTDPDFLRRFRARHRRGAPLLGFFTEGPRGLLFTPILEPPDRLPGGYFSLQLADADKWRIFDCRHGLVLLLHSEQLQVLVWDPVTGDQRRIAIPPRFPNREGMMVMDGAVLCAAGNVHGGTSSTFRVVLSHNDLEVTRAFVCVYSSENGVWSDPISITYPRTFVIYTPSAFVGSSLYWYLIGLDGDSTAILEFDLDRQRLALIDMPFKVSTEVWVIPADCGELGFLYLSNHNVYLWKRMTDGVAGWVLWKTIELNNLLPLTSDEVLYPKKILGLAEDDKVLLIGIGETDRIFTIQLESMKFVQFDICFATLNFGNCYPFSSVYTSGMGLGDEHEGTEIIA